MLQVGPKKIKNKKKKRRTAHNSTVTVRLVIVPCETDSHLLRCENLKHKKGQFSHHLHIYFAQVNQNHTKQT